MFLLKVFFLSLGINLWQQSHRIFEVLKLLEIPNSLGVLSQGFIWSSECSPTRVFFINRRLFQIRDEKSSIFQIRDEKSSTKNRSPFGSNPWGREKNPWKPFHTSSRLNVLERTSSVNLSTDRIQFSPFSFSLATRTLSLEEEPIRWDPNSFLMFSERVEQKVLRFTKGTSIS